MTKTEKKLCGVMHHAAKIIATIIIANTVAVKSVKASTFKKIDQFLNLVQKQCATYGPIRYVVTSFGDVFSKEINAVQNGDASKISKLFRAANITSHILEDFQQELGLKPSDTQKCNAQISNFRKFMRETNFKTDLRRCKRIGSFKGINQARPFHATFLGPNFCETQNMDDWEKYKAWLQKPKSQPISTDTPINWDDINTFIDQANNDRLDAWNAMIKRQKEKKEPDKTSPSNDLRRLVEDNTVPDLFLTVETDEGTKAVDSDPMLELEGGVRFGCETFDYENITVPKTYKVSCNKAVEASIQDNSEKLSSNKTCKDIYAEYSSQGTIQQMQGGILRGLCYAQYGNYSKYGSDIWMNNSISCNQKYLIIAEAEKRALKAPIPQADIQAILDTLKTETSLIEIKCR